MTGIDPERLERRLRWAAEQLGLNPDATLDEVRAVWLRRLPAEDFVPSSELSWALAVLLHRPTEGGWEARADEAAAVSEEERLRSGIEAFAEQFWDFPVSERRRRWQELRNRCEFALDLRARLRLLEPGLDCIPVVNEAKEDARVVELANHVRELFILRPGPRARARQNILRGIHDDRKEWKAAARRLRGVCPKLAALGKDMLDKIGQKPPKPKHLAKIRAAQPAASKSKGRKIPLWIFYILAAAASQIVRVACDHSPSSHNATTPLLHDNRGPQFRLDLWQELEKTKKIKEKLQKQNEEERRGGEKKQPRIINDKVDGKMR